MANTKPSDYRNPAEFKEVIIDMFLVYAKSPEFGTLSQEQRVHAVDVVKDLLLITKEDIKEIGGQP